MSFAANLPLLCIVACLVCSVVSSLLKGNHARILTVTLCAAVAIASGFVLALGLSSGANTTYLMGHYPHPWGNELRFGILEPILAICFSGVMLLCILGGLRHLKEDLEFGKRRFWYIMADLVLAALLALAYTNDLFTGYVFIEICTLSSCGLLMIRNLGRTTLASIRYMLFSLLGSGLFLLGVIILYNITGHLLIPSLHDSIAELYRTGQYQVPLNSAMCLMTVGLAIKSGLFPFHFWMPDTYGYATPASSGILSGIISKGYIFFLMKIIFQVFGREVFYAGGMDNVLFVLGLCGMVVGSLSAIGENDIFRMVAFSSAAQIGYVYLGIGLSPEAGFLAALFHILTHALTKPALFLSASRITDLSGSKRFKDMQGFGRSNPMAGVAFAFGAFSMIGIPLTMGFMSKFLFAMAAVREPARLIPTLMALAVSTVLNTFYFARTVIRLFNHPKTALPPRVRLKDQPFYTAAAIPLLLINLMAGVFASPLIGLLETGLQLFEKVG